MDDHVEIEERVTPLELFFDLVFVFAITQVTGLLSDDPTWSGLLRGLLVLAALWWSWAAYAWLTNTLDPEEGAVRLAMLGAMGAMLVAALAVPQAFGDDAVLFGVAYFAVRALHLVLYALAGRGDPDLFRAVLRLVPPATVGPALIVAAGFLDGAAQVGLWAAALAIDYVGVLVGGMRGWRVSPAHFAERHGLVVIIALGESIVAVGIGVSGLALELDVVTAALLGVAVAAALWWSYFDWVAIVAARRLGEARGAARARLARDAYSYLHLPMVAGIVLFALGVKKTLEHVGEPLETIPALGLSCGVALYLLAHVALRLRIGGGLGRGRPTAALVLIGLTPLFLEVPAFAAVAIVAVVCAALIAYEALRYREQRAEIRREAPTTRSQPRGGAAST
jgi:low temperature requirement protein LtrA